MSETKKYIEHIQDSLINAGFDRDFIETLDIDLVYELYIAWDVEDPDEQWNNVERFFLSNDIDYEYDKVFQ